MFQALILDWSGTLVDDSAPTLAATNAVLAKYGKDPMTWEHFRESFRLPYSEWYEEHVPGIALEELEEYFRAAFDCSDHVVTPLEGAADFLEWCHGNGIRLFVLTSMNVDCFRQQLVEFDFARFFECTYAGVVDKRSRIGEIMAAHGLEPTETAFVGDMAHDIDTAHHGGVTSVGVLSGYDPASRLVAARPGLMLSCIRSLHSLLMRTLPEAAARSQDAIVVRRLAVNCFVGVPEEERAVAAGPSPKDQASFPIHAATGAVGQPPPRSARAQSPQECQHPDPRRPPRPARHPKAPPPHHRPLGAEPGPWVLESPPVPTS